MSDTFAARVISKKNPFWDTLYRCTYVYLKWNQLLFRYEQQEIALNCGTMLRECIRYEALTKILLYSDNFYDFFKYVEVSTFDIASDAFATFKVGYKQLVFWKIGIFFNTPPSSWSYQGGTNRA